MGGQESARYAIRQFFLGENVLCKEAWYYQVLAANSCEPNHCSTQCQAHRRELILGIPIWLKGLVTVLSHLC